MNDEKIVCIPNTIIVSARIEFLVSFIVPVVFHFIKIERKMIIPNMINRIPVRLAFSIVIYLYSFSILDFSFKWFIA